MKQTWFSLGLIGVSLAVGVVFGADAARSPIAVPVTAAPVAESTPLLTQNPALVTATSQATVGSVATVAPTPEPTAEPTAAPVTIPESALVANVPFVPQAPHKNWDALHKETCEEASLLTLHYFQLGRRDVTPDEIEADLQAMVAWELERFGTYEDTTAEQTAVIAREYLGYGDRVRVIRNARPDDLRRELAAGHPVVVPAAGRLLGNRYFQTPGPIYHMTVAIGFGSGEITTNDPGTQHGAGYRYPIGIFWDAIHDFVDRTDAGMATGEKALLVIDPIH